MMYLAFAASIWWLFWLIVANLSLTGLRTPLIETNIFVIVFVLSIYSGAVLANQRKLASSTGINPYQISKIIRLYRASYIFSLPFVAFFFLKFLYLARSVDLSSFRLAVFSQGDTASILFGSEHIELMYSLVISPLLFLVLVLGIQLYYQVSEPKFLLASFALLALDSAMTLGRFFIYYFMVLLSTGFYLQNRQKLHVFAKILLVKSSIITKFIIAVILAIFVSISAIRSSENSKNLLFDFITTIGIEYHTSGFLLFENDLINDSSLLNQNATFGEASLSGALRVPILIIRRFDKSVDSSLVAHNKHRNAFANIGKSDQKLYNAFYTILYTMYLDFRFFGFIVPFALGYCLVYNYKSWVYKQNLASYFYVQTTFYILIFSLFLSPIESSTIFNAVLIYNISNRFTL